MSSNKVEKKVLNYKWRGPWATSTAYAVNDSVQQNGSGYICLTAHTSGTFATDLAAGKWSLFVEGYTKSGIVDLIYPVGAIYISVVSTSPATLFGGTWSAFGAGKTLVGLDSSDAAFDTAEETGGVKDVTLTSDQSGVPAHTHAVSSSGAHTHTTGTESATHTHTPLYGSQFVTNQTGINNAASSAGLNIRRDGGSTTSTESATHYHDIASSGAHTHTTSNNTTANATSAHTNLQPYIVTYMWKRTA